MNNVTVIGASGFIGRNLADHLERAGRNVRRVGRGDAVPDCDLGLVYFAAGVTADFRTRPVDTMAAHVSAVTEILAKHRFEKIVYLSSTRVYSRNAVASEEQRIEVNPALLDDLYNISKLAGESVGMASGRPFVAARLSNIIGDDFASPNFLFEVLRAAVDTGHVEVRVPLKSSKDYLCIQDALNALTELGEGPALGIYNVAAGANTTNLDLLNAIAKVTGCRFTESADAGAASMPAISVMKLSALMAWQPLSIVSELPNLIVRYKAQRGHA